MDRVDRQRGMDITIVTTASTDDEGRALLRLLGFPFRTDSGPPQPTAVAPIRRRRR
jgi:hypothetical protein